MTERWEGSPPSLAGSAVVVGRARPAVRVTGPRWRDGRVVAGVLLILISTALGARLLSGAARTTPVLGLVRAVAAGHDLESGDLQVALVRLGRSGPGYWPAAALPDLVGHRLLTAVGAGELLPRSAVATTADPVPTDVVSIPIDPGRLPPLASGDRVDLFATYRAGTGPTGVAEPGSTFLVLHAAEYLGGGDSGAGSTVSVRLRIPVSAEEAVVRASEDGALDVVLLEPAAAGS